MCRLDSLSDSDFKRADEVAGMLAETEDPERIAIREVLAFGKAVYDRRQRTFQVVHYGG